MGGRGGPVTVTTSVRFFGVVLTTWFVWCTTCLTYRFNERFAPVGIAFPLTAIHYNP